jgi:hypothetical protein
MRVHSLRLIEALHFYDKQFFFPNHGTITKQLGSFIVTILRQCPLRSAALPPSLNLGLGDDE